MDESVKDQHEDDKMNIDREDMSMTQVNNIIRNNIKIKSDSSVVNSTNNENIEVSHSLIKISSQVMDKSNEEPTSPRGSYTATEMDIDKGDSISMVSANNTMCNVI